MCVDSGVHYESDPDDVREEGGEVGCDFGDDVGYGPQFSVGDGPMGGVARVVVHVVVSLCVGQLQGAPPGDGREGGLARQRRLGPPVMPVGRGMGSSAARRIWRGLW